MVLFIDWSVSFVLTMDWISLRVCTTINVNVSGKEKSALRPDSIKCEKHSKTFDQFEDRI